MLSLRLGFGDVVRPAENGCEHCIKGFLRSGVIRCPYPLWAEAL